jgi:hypothetical protein
MTQSYWPRQAFSISAWFAPAAAGHTSLQHSEGRYERLVDMRSATVPKPQFKRLIVIVGAGGNV